MADVYDALRGHADVSDAVRALEPGEPVLRVDRRSGPHVLDDLGRLSDAVYDDSRRVEQRLGERRDLPLVVQGQPDEAGLDIDGGDGMRPRRVAASSTRATASPGQSSPVQRRTIRSESSGSPATVRPVESRPRWARESSIPSSSRPIGAGLPRDAPLVYDSAKPAHDCQI